MNQQDYIDHEVRIRLQEQLNDARFLELRTSINQLINYILGIYGIIGTAALGIVVSFLWGK